MTKPTQSTRKIRTRWTKIHSPHHTVLVQIRISGSCERKMVAIHIHPLHENRTRVRRPSFMLVSRHCTRSRKTWQETTKNTLARSSVSRRPSSVAPERGLPFPRILLWCYESMIYLRFINHCSNVWCTPAQNTEPTRPAARLKPWWEKRMNRHIVSFFLFILKLLSKFRCSNEINHAYPSPVNSC